MFPIGTLVRIVVPYGPNVGQETGKGKVVGHIYSRMDGDCYIVKEEDDSVACHAAAWIKK